MEQPAINKEQSELPFALSQIDVLDELLIKAREWEEDKPNIEAQTGFLSYRVNFDTNFEDRGGFVTGIAKYIEEATVHAALSELLVEGEQHAAMLYTWRSCSRGIPHPKADHPKREDFHKTVFEVLDPEVEKLCQLWTFQKDAIDKFCQEVKVLCHTGKKREFVSEACLLTLGKFINLFAVLDELKNFKAGLKNDYSIYRRATQFLRLHADAQTIQKYENLYVFLGTQNKIRCSLKRSLEEKIPNYVELFSDIINISVSMFESKRYLTQMEKHMLVKVIGFSLELIDNDNCTIYKLDHKKKINLERIDKIFHAVQIVPLYGDMQLSPFDYIKRSKHFEPYKWPLCVAVDEARASRQVPGEQVDIIKCLPKFAADYRTFVCQLQVAAAASVDAAKDDGKPVKLDTKEVHETLCQLALKGLQLLSEWTIIISELYSWKLIHPTDHHLNPNCPPGAEEYERATKYNYSPEEKSALVQIVALIKDLQATLSKQEALLSHAICRHIYIKTQTFVQITLREPLRKAVKKKKTILKSVLMSIRDTCADWIGNEKWAVEDPILKGKKCPLDENYKIGKRIVHLSSTQLYLLRTMLESLLSEKMCANKVLRHDLHEKHIPLIEEFYRKTFHWSHLMSFGEMLQQCGDLSQFWYREFYLEMTMGKRVQFPIDMSMPWIMLDHILSNPCLIEYALYPLDLYNDSCHYALNIFRKQFLYDELEAEVNLIFDHFLFKLSEQIFIFYKKQAATSLLDRGFRTSFDLLENGTSKLDAATQFRYESLMQQRRVYLLGHYIDLNKLIRQRIRKFILESLKVAIGKFQEGDLSKIVQLERLIAINKEAHKNLKISLHGLDDFDWLLREANHSITTSHGRATFHIFCELMYDFIPNYCYNGSTNRFVKAVGLTFSDKAMEHRQKSPSTAAVPPQFLWGSKQLNMAYSTLFKQYSGFIGQPHFRAMMSLLKYDGLALVIKEVLKFIEGLIKKPILQYVKELIEIMPKKSRIPIKMLCDEEGSSCVLAFYLEIMNAVMQQPNVRMEIFQHFRELGNALLLCRAIEETLNGEEICELFQVAPFINVHPLLLSNRKVDVDREPVNEQSKAGEKDESFNSVHSLPISNLNDEKRQQIITEKKRADLEAQAAALHVVGNLHRYGTKRQTELATEADTLSRERLCCGLTIFQEVLKEIEEFLGNEIVWMGSPPRNDVIHIDEGTEFHRVWSCLQFVYCLPVGENELSVEQLYGDSMNWGGCLLIALLRQQRRFELLDFSYRILEVYDQDQDRNDVSVKGVSMNRFAKRIRNYQRLNLQIFSLLNKHIITTDDGASGDSCPAEVEFVRCYNPPIHKSLLCGPLESSRISGTSSGNDSTLSGATANSATSPIYEELGSRRASIQSGVSMDDRLSSLSLLYRPEPNSEEATTDNIEPSAPPTSYTPSHNDLTNL